MMNNEDFERKMAFIVNQQAQFAVDIDKLRETQAKTEETVNQLAAAQIQTEAAQRKTEEVLTRLAYVTNEGFKDVNRKIDALVNSQIALQDSHKSLQDSQKELQHSQIELQHSQIELQVSQKELQDSHRLTEESVRQLTMTVDRYFKNRQNGG
jgi:chromosome segregation ATPase